MGNSFILYGNIIYSGEDRKFITYKNSYLVCINNKVEGIYSEIPANLNDLPFYNYENKLIIPGLIDLHVHASQYQFRGLGFDYEVLEWLDHHAFPEESKFKDVEYAKKAYGIFVNDLKKSFTTRLATFATLHKDATLELMKQIEESGLIAKVGLVNMNRNAPEYLLGDPNQDYLAVTEEWIKEGIKFKNVEPIITPRFTPSCTREYLRGLGKLRKQYNLPSMSHLDENLNEVEFVKELEPWSKNYAETYEDAGLLGGDHKCIMAHSIFTNDDERKLMKQNNVYVAHCPDCNMNVKSGIAPVALYLKEGIHVGLGTDVAGGSHLNLFREMAEAIQVSKLYYRYISSELSPLTAEDAFFIATRDGGSFFGKVGAFEKDYEFDALVLDDSSIETTLDLTLEERIERLIYWAKEEMILAKFANGTKII